MTMDVGEAEIAPLVAVSQLAMVDPKKVEDGGIEIVNMHGIGRPMGILARADNVTIPIGQVVPILIGLPVGDTGLHPAAGHPGGEGTGMVIPAIILAG